MLQKAKVKEIVMDDFSDPEAAAEGSYLSLYRYTDMKGKGKEDKEEPNITVSRYCVVHGHHYNQDTWSYGRNWCPTDIEVSLYYIPLYNIQERITRGVVKRICFSTITELCSLVNGHSL